MTQGKIWKHLLAFALPIMGGMLLQMLYNTVDGIIVGRQISEVALGAVNTSGSYANLLLAVASGLSTGASIVLSQYFGAKQEDKLHKAISTMVILMFSLGLFFTVIGEIGVDLVLTHILNVPEDAYNYAEVYLRIYFLGMIFQFLYNGFAAALRSVGNSGATLLFLVVSSICNIVLDLLFVNVFHWGVAGAAIATVISQALSVAISIWYIYTRQKVLAVSRSEFRFEKEPCMMILKTGIPIAIQTVISQLGTICMQRLINRFGSTFMAAIAAGGRVEQFTMVPILGFGQAMSVFAGQNAGAGDFKRVMKGLFVALGMAVGMSLVFSTLLYIFAGQLIGLFGCTGEALAIGTVYLKFMAFVFIISAVLFVARGMIQGCGDTVITTYITFGTLAFRVFIAYVMAGIESIGYKAVWYAMAIDFAIGTTLYIIRLASGKWKTKVVVKTEDAIETE